MDTDAESYHDSTSAKVLERAEREKRAKYKKACFEQRGSVMALVYSVGGMAGKSARAYEKQIASLLADKWSQEYSSVEGWVKARMTWCGRLHDWSRGGPSRGLKWRCNGISEGCASNSVTV